MIRKEVSRHKRAVTITVMNKIKVGIIGATGYAGAELVRLLANHPCRRDCRRVVGLI